MACQSAGVTRDVALLIVDTCYLNEYTPSCTTSRLCGRHTLIHERGFKRTRLVASECKMFKKLGTKLNQKKRDKVGRSPSKLETQGAAVPYTEPPPDSDAGSLRAEGSLRSHASSVGASSLLTDSSAEYGEGHLLGEAAARGDWDTAKQLLTSGYDINGRDDVSICRVL